LIAGGSTDEGLAAGMVETPVDPGSLASSLLAAAIEQVPSPSLRARRVIALRDIPPEFGLNVISVLMRLEANDPSERVRAAAAETLSEACSEACATAAMRPPASRALALIWSAIRVIAAASLPTSWAIVPTVPSLEREELANRVAAAAKRTDGIKGIVLNPTKPFVCLRAGASRDDCSW